MAINELRDIEEINGKKICVMDELRDKFPEKFNESGSMDYKWFESEVRDKHSIFLRHDKDSITFNMMTKPVLEGGKGCQFTDLIETSLLILKYLNKDYPCRENAVTITKLEEAIMWQEKRTKDRVSRDVEGKYEK